MRGDASLHMQQMLVRVLIRVRSIGALEYWRVSHGCVVAAQQREERHRRIRMNLMLRCQAYGQHHSRPPNNESVPRRAQEQRVHK